ncbi:Rieske domain-containing protein, partial [gut metagenome]
MVRSTKNILITTFVIVTALLGCTETIDDHLPYRPVNLELDLTYQDKELNSVLSYKIYTQQNIDQANEQT